MKSLLIFIIIIIICLIQVDESLFIKISHSNIVFASTISSHEINIPIIDRNILSSIKTATFAMG